ncbi:MAG: hypothetical protein ACRD1T_15170, partial [Acidimicrobiia bacterium]
YGRNPEYAGSVESMTTCTWDRIGIVRAGDTFALQSHYNSSAPQDDVMGINIIYVFETTDLEGGTPAPEWVQAHPPENQGTPKEHPH